MFQLNRRHFIQTTGALALPGAALAQERTFNPQPGVWRTFEFTTRVEIANPKGATRVWLPIPSIDSSYQQSLESTWTGNARSMQQTADAQYGAKMLSAEFAEGEARPFVELTSRFRTQNRAQDWSQKTAVKEDPATLKYWTQPTDLMPTDGIVKKTALEATKGVQTDVDKVRRLYDWVVNNTYREPKVRVCGTGDI